jgi:pSer/pThr/pTyr-binding forkhead associated (FHA) protein
MDTPETTPDPRADEAKKPSPPPTLLLPDESPTLSWLVVVGGPRRGKLYRIKRSGVTIGREADNDIVLEDETVSRHHARLMVEPGIGNPQVYIQDLATVNGTFINGKRIVRQQLQDEDRIAIGNTVFAFKHL